jgi:O-antigen/teichoic acid export membrane protein
MVAAWLMRNFTAIIWGLIARAVAMAVLTHFLAERPYRICWSRKDGPRFLHFALPLMLNGFMLFVGSQGDRVMVARQLGPSTMGEYQAVILLILYPSSLVMRYMAAVFLPLVAAARDDLNRRGEVVEYLGGLTFLLAVAMAAGFALVAPLMVPLLFGKRFSTTAIIAGMLGVLQTTRFLINWPTTVNLALGHSRAVLISSVAKLLVFPGAYIGFHLLGGIPGVVIGFIAGELISIFVGVALMDRHLDLPWYSGFDRLAYFVLFSAAIAGLGVSIQLRSPPMSLMTISFGASLLVWILRREEDTLASMVKAGQRVAKPWLLRIGIVS